MSIIIGIMLYNHPTLSDNWMLWILFGASLTFRAYQSFNQHKVNKVVEALLK